MERQTGRKKTRWSKLLCAGCEHLDLSPDDVAVTVDGVSYDQITAAECMSNVDGWYYSVQYTQITLCGTACDEFKAMATPEADVEYFCTGGA